MMPDFIGGYRCHCLKEPKIIAKRCVNCGQVTIHKMDEFLRHLRIALDTEVEAGGPYLNVEQRKSASRH